MNSYSDLGSRSSSFMKTSDAGRELLVAVLQLHGSFEELGSILDESRVHCFVAVDDDSFAGLLLYSH